MRMYRNADGTSSDYTYLHYACKGENIVCEGTSKEDSSGNPVEWQQVPNMICASKKERFPDAFKTPSCQAQGRSLPSQSKDAPKKSKVLMWAGIGAAALAVIIITGVVIKNRKK